MLDVLCTTDDLARMKAEEIEKAHFDPSVMPFLSTLMVPPIYQRRGIGTRLLKFGMSSFPKTAVYTSEDGQYSSKGVVNLGLWATSKGHQVYLRAGWYDLYEHDLKTPDLGHIHGPMKYTRMECCQT